MPLTAPRWRRVTESQYPWEREAIEFLATHLPGHEPVRLWSNFEFVSNDGYVNEVDALVLTAKGLFLVEIKSRPARRVSGDAYAWTWGDGPSAVETDNPLIPTDRKARRLASLLAPLERRESVRLPFIEALVFCSAPGLDLSLPANLATRVFVRGRRAADGIVTAPGIVEALTNPDVGPRRTERPVETTLAQALVRSASRRSPPPRRRCPRGSSCTRGDLPRPVPPSWRTTWPRRCRPQGQWEVLAADEVQRRVWSRFPEAERLPDRPALTPPPPGAGYDLLGEADWNVMWDEGLVQTSCRLVACLTSALTRPRPTCPPCSSAWRAASASPSPATAARSRGWCPSTSRPRTPARWPRSCAASAGAPGCAA
jgi:hypothetical protein